MCFLLCKEEDWLIVLQAVGILQTLNVGDYHVTVISPDTFTTFTPLLPCEEIP
jgi:hypothetical protein